MKIFATVLSFVLVLAGVYFNRRNSVHLDLKVDGGQDESVQGVEDEAESDTESFMEQDQSSDLFSDNTEEISVEHENTTSTITTQPKDILSSYKYPNSTILGQSASTFEQESPDDPEKITDWYKEKIKSDGMNIKTFVTTTTNGNVYNELVGAGLGGEIRVVIEKSRGEDITDIVVNAS